MTELLVKSINVPGDEEDEEMECSLKSLKRNLDEEFSKPCNQDSGNEHMKVYLRIRPFTGNEVVNNEDQVSKLQMFSIRVY